MQRVARVGLRQLRHDRAMFWSEVDEFGVVVRPADGTDMPSPFVGELLHGVQAGGVEQVRAGQQHQLAPPLRTTHRRRHGRRVGPGLTAGASTGDSRRTVSTRAACMQPHQTDRAFAVATLYCLSDTAPGRL